LLFQAISVRASKRRCCRIIHPKGSITRQPLLACFEKLLRPTVVKALCDAFAPTQLRDGLFATQTIQNDVYLFLG
jgi:hypothetical protein